MRRKRLPGGQPGNRNGLKHGLYSTQLTAQERRMFLQARKMQGVGDELAVFRVKFSQMLSDPWLSLRSLALALSVVTRAEALQYKIQATHEKKEHLADNLAAVLTSVGAAMGLEGFEEEDEGYEDNRDGGGSTLIHYGYGPDRYNDPQFDLDRIEGGFAPTDYGQHNEFGSYQYDALADGGGYEGGGVGDFYRVQGSRLRTAIRAPAKAPRMGMTPPSAKLATGPSTELRTGFGRLFLRAQNRERVTTGSEAARSSMATSTGAARLVGGGRRRNGYGAGLTRSSLAEEGQLLRSSGFVPALGRAIPCLSTLHRLRTEAC